MIAPIRIPRPALALVRAGTGEGEGGPPAAPPDAREAIVVRFGELFLKGGNRGKFLDAVRLRTRRAVADLGAAVRPVHGRLIVEGVGHAPEALARLRGVFGVSSVSPAWLLGAEVADWERLAVERAKLARARGARSFAIATERPDKAFPLRSIEISSRLGAAVVAAAGLDVNLGRPDWTFHVEVGREAVFAWEGALAGAGGLPTGTGGRALLLLSGGIDSPVAGHLAQKRGVVLAAVYFDAFPYTGPGAREKAVDLARVLAGPQDALDLYVVPFAPVQERLRDGAPADYLVLLYRRMMVRVAEKLAARTGAVALVTGESLGQVASQTIENLACIEAAATMPILRPLISFDKSETIALARRLGTYEISIRPHADCCSLFVAKHPVTRGRAATLGRLERAVDWTAVVDQAVAATETVRVGEGET
ncbi:MAG: tRNA 4-thiouridine(8) synthase ThiI [Deltaproteobacteria bacterium]|nr:tRNA 4-thiouridine(8) synthase ThiI [Deltaproteobacteria bacterium]